MIKLKDLIINSKYIISIKKSPNYHTDYIITMRDHELYRIDQEDFETLIKKDGLISFILLIQNK